MAKVGPTKIASMAQDHAGCRVGKVATSCPKLPQVATSCPKLPQVAPSCHKLPQVAPSCHKLPKRGRGFPKKNSISLKCPSIIKHLVKLETVSNLNPARREG